MKHFFVFLSVILSSLTLTGCGHYKPIDFPKQGGDQESPGLFSGKKGKFEIGMPVPWASSAKEDLQSEPTDH